jgi:phosphatidylglycerol:prolipoprotein diacylglycerol transferase
MRQTLFEIPFEYHGIPIFRFGVLLAVWVLFSAGLLWWLSRKQGFNADTKSYIPLLALVALAIIFLPKVFDGALPIRGYGVMMLLGVASGVALAVHRARQVGIHPEVVYSFAFWMFISGIVGARLFHVRQKWEELYRIPDEGELDYGRTVINIINVPGGGLVVYGALIGVALALVAFIWKNNLPGLAFCDLIAPGMALGLALGRIGCLMNGCCFGGQCDGALAITFPFGSPPHIRQVGDGEIPLHGLKLKGAEHEAVVIASVETGSAADKAGFKAGDRIDSVRRKVLSSDEVGVTRRIHNRQQITNYLLELKEPGQSIDISVPAKKLTFRTLTVQSPPRGSLPVHPTQIYSAINGLLMCLFLVAYTPFRRRDGEVFALLLTIYPIARYLIEEIRADEAATGIVPITISQWVSVLILLAIVGLWIVIVRRPRGSAVALSPLASPPPAATTPAAKS